MRSGLKAVAAGLLAVTAGLAAFAPARAEELGVNDFPTAARADYVFACMQVNGQTREMLEKCSCSVDVIASLMPYQEYEAVETILMVYKRGGKAQEEMGSITQQKRVKDMRRAQVEGELRCF